MRNGFGRVAADARRMIWASDRAAEIRKNQYIVKLEGNLWLYGEAGRSMLVQCIFLNSFNASRVSSPSAQIGRAHV